MSDTVILYNTEDGGTQLRLKVQDGTVWLSQAELAELFQTTKQNVSLHLKTIFRDAELAEASVVKDYLTTAADGKAYQTKHYRLEAILAVGYRVRSPRGSQFRRWATHVLQDYLIKGFAIDDARLKEPAAGLDYFDELLERIREIRASEKRFYQKVRELFATAVDYDKTSETARRFFQAIQNKMLWAVTGQTAAELILNRADPAKPNMGLNAWSGTKVRKIDVATAKNYLADAEMRDLDRLVSAFLDLAEDRAERRQQTTMADWIGFADQYLKLAERAVLTHAGSVSHENMLKVIDQRYATFDAARKASDKRAAEVEYEQDVESELRALESAASRSRKPLPPNG
ncbi:putative DNA-binding protein [Paramagnetospirillum caucaseum]|uniref:Putative DNA-binding protein n=1 Tax=Paramagnetospirillum caucaseum TaxID=1244869 RepID=M2ZMV9_9PROT|nr:virulence RhuM family protein [Paramagnetospirillum caucaseum]EME68612.1 putative DNA-binding protein [Paramagnetospirillum caucaseum]